MSERAGLSRKDGGGKTKYSSLNLNQTYKGSQPDRRTAGGGRHGGLQSLGKVQGVRRPVPAPANLPSLKFENAGNDPSVSIVPSGGCGWGATRDSKPLENGPSGESRPRPVAAGDHSRQQPTPSGRSGDGPSSSRTWGNVPNSSEPNGRVSSGTSHRFHRDFPTLGREDDSAPLHEEREDTRHYVAGPAGPPLRPQGLSGGQSYSHPGVDFHRHIGPGLSERSSRPGQYGLGPGHMGTLPYAENGRGPYQVAPPSSGYRQPSYRYPPPHSGSYLPPQPDGSHSERAVLSRPATVRPEAIQRLDRSDEDDESGWAGQQEEVDFNAKLTWGDSDEELELRSGGKGSAVKEKSWWKGQVDENARQWQQAGQMHRYQGGPHRASWQHNGPSMYYHDHPSGSLPPADSPMYYHDEYQTPYRYDRHNNHQPPSHNHYPDHGQRTGSPHDVQMSQPPQTVKRAPEKVEPSTTKSSVEQARMRWNAEEERRKEQKARAEAKLLELERRRAACAPSAAVSSAAQAPTTASSTITTSSTSTAPVTSRRSPEEMRQQDPVAKVNVHHFSDQQQPHGDVTEVRPLPTRADFQPHYVNQYCPEDHRYDPYSRPGRHDIYNRPPSSEALMERSSSSAAPPKSIISRPLPSPEPRKVDLSQEKDHGRDRKETAHSLSDRPSDETMPPVSEPSTTTTSGQDYQRSRTRRGELTLRAMNDDRPTARNIAPVPKRPDSVRTGSENTVDDHVSDGESKSAVPPMKIMTRQKEDITLPASRAATDSTAGASSKASEPSGESGAPARPVAAVAPPPAMSAWGKKPDNQPQIAAIAQSLRPEEWPTAEQSKGMAAPRIKEDPLKDRSILQPAPEGIRRSDRPHEGYDHHLEMDEHYEGRSRRDRYDPRERPDRYSRDRRDFEGRDSYDRDRRERYGSRERPDRYRSHERPDKYSQHDRSQRYGRERVDGHEELYQRGTFRDHSKPTHSHRGSRTEAETDNGFDESEDHKTGVARGDRESGDSKETPSSDDSRDGSGSRPESTDSGLQRNVRGTEGQTRELYRGYEREYGRESRRNQRPRSSDVNESSRDYDRYRDGDMRRGRSRGVRGGRGRMRDERLREPVRGRRYNDYGPSQDGTARQSSQSGRAAEKERVASSEESSNGKEVHREHAVVTDVKGSKVLTRPKENTVPPAGKTKESEKLQDTGNELPSGKETATPPDGQVKEVKSSLEHTGVLERSSRTPTLEDKEQDQRNGDDHSQPEQERRARRPGDMRERDRPRDGERERREKSSRERPRSDRERSARDRSERERGREHIDRGFRGERGSRVRDRAYRERGDQSRGTREQSVRDKGEHERGDSRRYNGNFEKDIRRGEASREHDDNQQGPRAQGTRLRREADGNQGQNGKPSSRVKGSERQRREDSNKEAAKNSDGADHVEESGETTGGRREQTGLSGEHCGKEKQSIQSESVSGSRNSLTRRTIPASSWGRGRSRQATNSRQESEGRAVGLRREGRDGKTPSSGRASRDAKESASKRKSAMNSSTGQGQTSGRVKSFSRQRPGSSKSGEGKDGSASSKSADAQGKIERSSHLESNGPSRRPIRKDVKREQKASSPTFTAGSSTPPIKRNPLQGIDLNSATVCIIDNIPDHSSSSSSADADDSAGFQTVLSRGKQQKEKRERRQATEELRQQEVCGSEDAGSYRSGKASKDGASPRLRSQQQVHPVQVKSKSSSTNPNTSQPPQPVSSSAVSPVVTAASSSLFSSGSYPNVASYALTVSGTTANSSDWSMGSTTTTSSVSSSSTTWSEPPATSQAYLVSPFDTPLLFSSGNQSTSPTVGAVGTRTASTSGPMLSELIKAGPPTNGTFASNSAVQPQGAVGQKVVKTQAKAPGTGKPASAVVKTESRGRGRGSRPRSSESTTTRPGYSQQGSSSNGGSQPDLSAVGVKSANGSTEGRPKSAEKNASDTVATAAPKPKRQPRTRVRVDDGKAKEGVQGKDGDVLPLASSPSAGVASSQLALHSTSSADTTADANLPPNPQPAVSPASDLTFSQLSFNDGTWSVLDSSNKPTDEREATTDHASVRMSGSKSTGSSVGATEQLAAKTQQAAYNAWHAESTDEPTGSNEGARVSAATTGDEDKLAGQGLAMNPFLGVKQNATPHSGLFPSQGMFAPPLFPKALLQQPHYVFPQPQPPPQPRGFGHEFLTGGFSNARSAALGPYIQSTIGSKVGQQQPRMMLATNLQSSTTGPGVMPQTLSTALPQPMMMNTGQRSSLVRSGAYTQGQTLVHPQVAQVHAAGAQPVPGVGGYIKQQQQQTQQAQASTSRMAGVMTGSKLSSGSELSKLVDAKPFTPLSSSTEQALPKFESLGQRSQTLAGLGDLAQQQQQAVYGGRTAHAQAQAALNAGKMAALAQPMPHYASQQQQYGTPFQQAATLPPSFGARHPPPVQHSVLGQQHLMAQRVVAAPHSIPGQGYTLQGMATQHQHTAGLIGPPPVGAPTVTPTHAFVHGHSTSQRQSSLPLQHSMPSLPIAPQQTAPDPQKQRMREAQQKCLQETSTYMREQREKEEIARLQHQALQSARMTADSQLSAPLKVESKVLENSESVTSQASQSPVMSLADSQPAVTDSILKAEPHESEQQLPGQSEGDTPAAGAESSLLTHNESLPSAVALETAQLPLLGSVSSSALSATASLVSHTSTPSPSALGDSSSTPGPDAMAGESVADGMSASGENTDALLTEANSHVSESST